MTALSAEESARAVLLDQALNRADEYATGDLISHEMELFITLAAEVRRLHARVRFLEEQLNAKN